MTDIAQWQAVPARVAELLPEAIKIKEAYLKVAAQTGDLAGTTATWDTEDNVLVLYRPKARTKLSNVVNGRCAVLRDHESAPDWAREVLIKAAAIPVVSQAFDFGNKALGGPTPLSNAIVSGLMLGGLGYGAGTLAENLFPERYVERGKLRRTLGLMGLGAGGVIGANNAYAMSRTRPDIGFWKSWITPNTTSVDAPAPPPTPAPDEKVGFSGFPSQQNQRSLFAPTVSVPQFNSAAWQDVQRGLYTGNSQFTPPAYAAATTGLMTGISTAQRSPIIRPVDVIRGIASAGVGLATANVAGRALSALAGLTPLGQEKLQDMGLWGGMMHAIVPAMFNSNQR
jgi:hypothetical protein